MRRTAPSRRRCHGDQTACCPPPAAHPAQIPVRKITDEDLRWSLRQGLDDFRDMRGDLFFAGLIYTFIGIAAVVMTTNGPLMPFFFPVVAGVGLLGPVAAVGFYELARRREEGQDVHWFNFLDVRKRPSVDDMGIVAGLLLAIFALWLLAAGAALRQRCSAGRRRPRSPASSAMVFTTPARLGADRWRRGRRRDLRLDRARAQRRLAADAGRLRRQRRRSRLRLVARGARQQAAR